MDRVFNFSAGPSMLPLPVLEKAQKELLNYRGAGCGVMEMSHRSSAFEEIRSHAEASLRALLSVPEGYAVLFLQGGATLQFSAVPQNLAPRGGKADYILTGEFSRKAHKEAGRWLDAEVIASSQDSNFNYIPAVTPDKVHPDAKYVHITVNNTIFGTMYQELPLSGSVPLVGDMSSIILGRHFDVSRFGLIYAGAQKNIGCAGLTIVLVRRSLLSETDPLIPPLLQYLAQDKNQSMVNTPPTYAIYIAGLVFDWIASMGGVAGLQSQNEEKARLLYEYLDNSKIFRGTALPKDRSLMNAVFTVEGDTEAFLKKAQSCGLINLKGHRVIGGCRASLYNAMPKEGVQALIQCMKEFETGA